MKAENCKRLLIFETHPIPYRAPIFVELNRLTPKSFEVIYGSDFSVRGYSDRDFGCTVSWDNSLLYGYDYRVLNNDQAGGIERRSGISGHGVCNVIQEANPSAILLHSFGYNLCTSVFWNARRRGIPLWIRTETQDGANRRSFFKRVVRSTLYRFIYSQVSVFFVIGLANREHYLRHGVAKEKLRIANYCTPNPNTDLSESEKRTIRGTLRRQLGIADDVFLVAFVGKLSFKKNPRLLLDAWMMLPLSVRASIVIVFVGKGELESELMQTSKDNILPCHFVGFVNQLEISKYYLAVDMLVLPSRRMGETWGLVVNEALDAGCAVAMSDAVGCGVDFGDWERVRVFQDGNALALSRAIQDSIKFERDFSWATERMKKYSICDTALSLATEIQASEK